MHGFEWVALSIVVVVVALALGFLGGRISMKCAKCGAKIHESDL